ncbi:MAG: UvrD-helicase domain-containing protein, partial [Gemmatimonadota bacterium]
MRTPTPSQYRAIVNADRHVLVVAGAGSGKTSTVVGRILHLLGVPTPAPGGESVPASARAPIRLADLAAITFTNAAAADLKDRLRSELRKAGRRQEVYEVDGARIGTIHSFCVDVLREFALRSGQNPAFEALEEGDSAAVLADAASSTLIAAVEEGVAGLETLLAAHSFDGVSAWLIALASDGDRLARLAGSRGALGGPEQVVLELALRTSSRAQSVLEAQGDLDFDRMITRTRDLLRDNPEIRRALQRRIHTLIVDEFQDVDPAQKEIAMLLGDPTSGRSDTTRLLLVGDPKQSIYRFRRADVTLWSEVERTFEAGAAGDVIRLKENFRSVPEILGFVDRVIGPILDQPLDGAQLQPFEAPYQHLDPMAQVTR